MGFSNMSHNKCGILKHNKNRHTIIITFKLIKCNYSCIGNMDTSLNNKNDFRLRLNR